MKIWKVLSVAMLVAGSAQLQAVTVEVYEKHKADPASTEAVFDQLYIDGLGDGMRAANVTGFLNSAKLGSPALLYCPPPRLALQTENYIAILEGEIKRRLDLAGDDPIKIRAVMQTSIDHVLMDGLVNTFPCSSAKIQEYGEAFLQQLPPTKKKE